MVKQIVALFRYLLQDNQHSLVAAPIIAGSDKYQLTAYLTCLYQQDRQQYNQVVALADTFVTDRYDGSVALHYYEIFNALFEQTRDSRQLIGLMLLRLDFLIKQHTTIESLTAQDIDFFYRVRSLGGQLQLKNKLADMVNKEATVAKNGLLIELIKLFANDSMRYQVVHRVLNECVENKWFDVSQFIGLAGECALALSNKKYDDFVDTLLVNFKTCRGEQREFFFNLLQYYASSELKAEVNSERLDEITRKFRKEIIDELMVSDISESFWEALLKKIPHALEQKTFLQSLWRKLSARVEEMGYEPLWLKRYSHLVINYGDEYSRAAHFLYRINQNQLSINRPGVERFWQKYTGPDQENFKRAVSEMVQQDQCATWKRSHQILAQWQNWPDPYRKHMALWFIRVLQNPERFNEKDLVQQKNWQQIKAFFSARPGVIAQEQLSDFFTEQHYPDILAASSSFVFNRNVLIRKNPFTDQVWSILYNNMSSLDKATLAPQNSASLFIARPSLQQLTVIINGYKNSSGDLTSRYLDGLVMVLDFLEGQIIWKLQSSPKLEMDTTLIRRCLFKLLDPIEISKERLNQGVLFNKYNITERVQTLKKMLECDHQCVKVAYDSFSNELLKPEDQAIVLPIKQLPLLMLALTMQQKSALISGIQKRIPEDGVSNTIALGAMLKLFQAIPAPYSKLAWDNKALFECIRVHPFAQQLERALISYRSKNRLSALEEIIYLDSFMSQWASLVKSQYAPICFELIDVLIEAHFYRYKKFRQIIRLHGTDEQRFKLQQLEQHNCDAQALSETLIATSKPNFNPGLFKRVEGNFQKTAQHYQSLLIGAMTMVINHAAWRMANPEWISPLLELIDCVIKAQNSNPNLTAKERQAFTEFRLAC
jgi:hypothetical protein